MSIKMKIMEAGEFFGERMMHVKGRELDFCEYRYPTSGCIPKHAHAHGFVSLLVAGRYVERVGSDERVSPRRAVYHSPFEEHGETFGNNGATLFGFHISDEMLLFLKDCDVRVDESMVGLCVRDTSAMLRIVNLLRSRSKIDVFRAETVAMELLAQLPAKIGT
jgi:hypothetical protein